MSAELSELVLSVPFNRHVELEGEGEWLALELKDTVTNHIGTMHAGALFTLGEAASGLCAMRALGAVFVEARAVTRSASIEFRRPAVGRIRALGSPLQPVRETLELLDREGRASFEVVVRLLDRNDVEVAELRIVWSLRRPLST